MPSQALAAQSLELLMGPSPLRALATLPDLTEWLLNERVERGGKAKQGPLIVDDDERALRSMARVMEDESYQVVTAASGSEAIALLKQDPFDLVLTDLKMPGADRLGEDEPMVLRVIRAMLEDVGYRVLTAADDQRR